MTEVFSIPIISTLNEDGTHDHIRIMSKGPQEFSINGVTKCHKAVFNRVLVMSGDYGTVLDLRERLPEVFQQLDPVRITDLLVNDWRAEPQRLIYGSQKDFSDHAIILGNYMFYSYSMIVNVGGKWADARDASNTKWGRACEGWHSNPATITTTDVLNGVRKLEDQ